MRVLFILALLSFHVSAAIEKVSVQNVDFEYVLPYGIGSADKVGIGVGFNSGPLVIEIERTESTFEVKTPQIDFTWTHPLKFLHNLDAFGAKKINASAGYIGQHFVDGALIIARPKDSSDNYVIEELKGACEGSASGKLLERVMDDCRKKLDLTVKRVDAPKEFILYRLLEGVPRDPRTSRDIPGDNMILTLRDGQFDLQIYVKYWFYAGVRLFGQLEYENDHKVVALRIDSAKFGYLNVRSIMFRRLKEIMKDSPNVTVDPPWVKINIEKYNERI